jgi:hypothetical protein
MPGSESVKSCWVVETENGGDWGRTFILSWWPQVFESVYLSWCENVLAWSDVHRKKG